MRLSLLIIPMIILLLLVQNCKQNENTARPMTLQRDSTVVSRNLFYKVVKGYGKIDPVFSLDLHAEFEGRVSFSRAVDSFQKDQLIYRLAGPAIDLKEQQLLASLETARADFKYYDAVYQRKKTLIEKQVLPRRERDEILRGFKDAQQALKNAQKAYDYFHSMIAFKAPYAGRLTDVQVEQGTDVRKGQYLARFISRDKLKLVATFYGDPQLLRSDSTFTIQFDGNRIARAHLIYLEKVLNPHSGGHQFWAVLDSVSQSLNAGEYVHYRLLYQPHNAAAVPASALIRENSRYFVVQIKNGEYRNCQVRVGQQNHNLYEIEEGLSPGDTVLTTGAFEVFHAKLSQRLKVAD